MASSPTELYLPPTFPYPIKIVSIDSDTPTSIQRGARLLSYSFVHLPLLPDAQPETRFGTWDAAIEGTVHKWNLKTGDVISLRKAKEKPAVVVIEPCKHGMQIGGLCVLCGKDMTNTDYTGFSDASRASIQMTHSAFGPTVSLEEAQRIERETAENLLKSRKLSLIVDLDQTIVHATVDPTVGEWITEGEDWEARQAKRASSSKADPDESSDDSSSGSDDECNPNWEALKDVKKFRLGPESFGPPSFRGPQKGKGKNKVIENEGCMYYIKPRPGWKDFLRDTAMKYEMHVYTMGTRAYAEEVCAAIDPDGKVFGGRLLSRDESGSLTQKSLQRLFPCDTSMVVIIDDRADVWEWSPNLIKVVPYDFFVGIGDINSTFLPKVDSLTVPTPPKPPPGETTGPPQHSIAETEKPSTENRALSRDGNVLSAASASAPASSDAEEERAKITTKAMLTQNSLALEAQLEERPLAKKQEELQEVGSTPNEPQPSQSKHNAAASGQTKEESSLPSSKPEKVMRKALLKNDDFELERVGKLLDVVHERFFAAYEARVPSSSKRKSKRPEKISYDVTQIIPRLRTEVLDGVHILFSSVIPLDTKPESTEIWKTAHMFGARCSTEFASDITHVVAAKRGTVKVDTARKRGGIKIVWLAWFTDSVALWRHQDETPYLLDDPPVAGPSSSPTTDSNQISSDPDPDGDDWDQDPVEGKDRTSLELDDIDWNDINDEVEAAMNESDDDDNDDDTRSERSGMRSGNVSDEDWTDETNSAISSVNNTPKLMRKRLRSATPPDGGSLNGDHKGNDGLRSPLAKRKKLATDRTGYSKLKETITAEELQPGEGTRIRSDRAVATPSAGGEGFDEEDDGDGDEEDEEEDDFLARELEEEWG